MRTACQQMLRWVGLMVVAVADLSAAVTTVVIRVAMSSPYMGPRWPYAQLDVPH